MGNLLKYINGTLWTLAGADANSKKLARTDFANAVVNTATSAAFGTTTTSRWIQLKPLASNSASQTVDPTGQAATGFGWNLPSSVTDAYVTKEDSSNSMMGLVSQKPPTLTAAASSPFGSAFGNCFRFTADAVSSEVGALANEEPGVNFSGFGTGPMLPPTYSLITSPWGGFGNAMVFDGVERTQDTFGIDCGTTATGVPGVGGTGAAGAFCIEAKVVLNSLAVFQAIAGRVTSNSAGNYNPLLFFSPTTGGKFAVSLRNNAGGNPSIVSTTTPVVGVSYTVAATYDGTNLRLFVNGVLETTTALAGVEDSGTTAKFYIGRYHSGGASLTWAFNGTIEEVRWSNTARYTATYTPAAAPFTTDSSTLGLWHLDTVDVRGFTPDSSGNGYHGRVTGGLAAPFTLDARFDRERQGFTETLYGWQDDVPANRYLVTYLDQNAARVNRLTVSWVDSGGTQRFLTTTGAVANGVHTSRVSYDGTTLRLYVDGTLHDSLATTVLMPVIPEFWVGRSQHITIPAAFQGSIDGVRVSNIARTTGASYTVEVVPHTLDANTVFLWKAEDLADTLRVLRAGTTGGTTVVIQATASDPTVNVIFVTNFYRRSAAGVYTFITSTDPTFFTGGAQLTATGYNRTSVATPSDVIFNKGDTFHVELWMKHRGGGATGVTSQTFTLHIGDASVIPDVNDTSARLDGGPGFNLVYLSTPSGSLTPIASLGATFAKFLTGGISNTQLVGTINKKTSKYLLATIATLTGGLTKTTKKFFTAAITALAGNNIVTPVKRFTGTIAPTAVIFKTYVKYITAAISNTQLVGALKKYPRKFFTATIASNQLVGTVGKVVKKYLTGFFYGTGGGGGATIIKKFFSVFDD